ncbi:hypothetical protein ACIO1C_00815 [Streptomyces sp. NPDC087420]|uniref:caspase, EACC1-associated type n=1 Tax=Streptomyces sp. NPDC087420 TaxID=3365785 RepID=UPI003836E4D3
MEWGDARDLTGADCSAVVVGTGSYPAGSPLTDLPSALRSAAGIAGTLRSVCGMPEERVRLIEDPDGPTDVLGALAEAIERADGGIVVFCFVGHGLLGPGDQLYLATSGGASADSSVHAVPYAEIKNRLSAAGVRSLVILDCCFSGLAEPARHGLRADPYVSARPNGSFLLASATHYASSFAPEGDEHTLFSGALLRLLREGDAGGPKWLTLSETHRRLDRQLRGAPARPHTDSVGGIGDLVLAANARYIAPSAVDESAAGGQETEEGPCPYPGMRPFLPEQRHLFFGREELTRALVRRAKETGQGAGPLVLVGPSGVGKSSLLRAGLGARLGSVPGSSGPMGSFGPTGAESDAAPGPVLLLPAPGPRPFRSLVTSWASAVGVSFGEAELALGAGRFPQPAKGHKAPGYLVVDQFEEIFTHCEDPEERELFIRALTGASSPEDDAVLPGPRLVLALRADYFGACLRDPRLSVLVTAGQFTVPPMTDDELREAIELPAVHAGLRLESGLSDLLLRELSLTRGGNGNSIALPFLAHALQETWARRRQGGLLTFAGYQATGGIGTSVARVAGRLHDSLDEAGRAELRELCLRLVRLVDNGGVAVRRRVRTEELGDNAGELLRRLVDARLVIVDDGEAQLCHDSLLHGWPLLQEWINADLDGLLVRRRLADAADAWEESGRPAGGLYAGRHLAAARSLTADVGKVLPMRPVEDAFLRAGDRAERRKRRTLTAVGAVVLALAVVASLLAVTARGAQKDAESRETDLIARRVAAQADTMRERDPLTALQLSLAAYGTARTTETRSSLYAAYTTLAPVELRGTRKAVLNVTFRADDRVLATSQRGGRVQLWEMRRGARPRKAKAIEAGKNAAIAFHPSSRLLAVLAPDRLSLWDTTDPYAPRRVGFHATTSRVAFTAAFSPDGKTLAGGYDRGKLRLWDLSAPTAPVLRAERVVSAAGVALISLSFSRDGRLLATAHGRGGRKAELPAEVKLWDTTDPARPVLRATAPTETLWAVAFHPRRDLLVTTGAQDRLEWWDARGGRTLRKVKAEDYERVWGGVSGQEKPSLSFRPDGGILAAADRDAGVALRKVGREDTSLYDDTLTGVPGGEAVQAVAYNRDGTSLAAGDVGGAVRIWPQRPPAPAADGSLAVGDPGTEAVSRDGTLMVTRSADEKFELTSQVWDIGAMDKKTGVTASPRLRFEVPKQWEARYFLPGAGAPVLLGHRWIEGTDSHTFRLWEFGENGAPVPRADIPFKTADPLTAVSRDGSTLAIGAGGGRRVELWDIRDRAHPLRRAVMTVNVDLKLMTSGALWFAGNRTLITLERSDLRLWDLTDPAHPRQGKRLVDAAAGEASSYFAKSGLLLTDSVAETVKVWDISDVTRPRELSSLEATDGGYYSAGDDGNTLATALSDGTVELVDLTDPRHPRPKAPMRFDRPIDTFELSPDGSQMITSAPYRIWDIGADGRWQTPSRVTLDVAEKAELLPGKRPVIAVLPKRASSDEPEQTFLLDLDTDRIHKALCADHPESVSQELWKSLFPGIRHLESCT